MARGIAGEVEGLAVTGADRRFVAARAVRDGNLYNAEGMPAAPFRSAGW